MKKKTISNLIMVLLVAAMLSGGFLLARFFMGDGSQTQFGADFSGTQLADESGEYTCTITISCDTVLAHPNQLNQAKAPYIPDDGVILTKTTVAFKPGQTAFDVLQRVCEKGNIQLEYSWTPLYDSYYIEGINHLYEFDCGPESGWMYKVNGVFPNYGCSSYEVKMGDDIVWCYTCQGLGTDVGAQRME